MLELHLFKKRITSGPFWSERPTSTLIYIPSYNGFRKFHQDKGPQVAMTIKYDRSLLEYMLIKIKLLYC